MNDPVAIWYSDRADVRTVSAGLSLDGFNDYQEGDQLEFYHSEKVAAS